MSGDFGPRVTLPAALAALPAHPGLHLHLVGNAPDIEAYLTSLAAQQVAGVVSAGSTAALMALGRQRVSMLPGFARPALCSSLPAETGLSYMLDLGANVEADSQSLLEFALLGSALARALDGIASPRVALLSNGTEPSKGNTAMREAAARMEADAAINYCGYIEGSDLYLGKADVIVCDGFVGNVSLKTSEGLAKRAPPTMPHGGWSRASGDAGGCACWRARQRRRYQK